MKFYIPSNRLKVVLVFLLVLLGIGSFAYNQYLIDNILKQERSSVELWAKAMEYTARSLHEETRNKLMDVASDIRQSKVADPSTRSDWVQAIEQAESDLASASLDFVASELIVKNRFEIPSIVVDEQGDILFSRNIKEKDLDSGLVQEYKAMHAPINITIGDESYHQQQKVYYGESPTVRLLRYYPYIQFGLLAVLLFIGYTSYQSISKSEQSSLWVGMAKEAAHQLGTPISSLYGWVELLRDQNNDEFSLRVAHELENDIRRLQGVAERFNKIGSEPELKYRRVGPILEQVVDYMERRLPQLGKNVEVRRDIEVDAKARVNAELFQWAVENLIKNAMDAIRSTSGEAYVSVQARLLEDELIIDVEDSGIGIEKKYFKEIFKPGYSTKKRGWGLGLSLTKRIIEEYHRGRIFVLKSEKDKGTTIRIVLKAERPQEQVPA